MSDGVPQPIAREFTLPGRILPLREPSDVERLQSLLARAIQAGYRDNYADLATIQKMVFGNVDEVAFAAVVERGKEIDR